MDKKLESFSKSEIIASIRKMERYYIAKGLEKNIIDIIQESKREKAFAEANLARQTSIDRMNEFFNWKKEMAEKYGNGKQFKLSDLPHYQIERGANLQNAWIASENEKKRLEKLEDKYYEK